MAGWLNPPPLIALSGNVALLRVREIKKAVAAAGKKKRRVERVSGDSSELDQLLASTVFFDEKMLLIISKPEKVDPELLIKQSTSSDKTVVMVLDCDGTLKKNSKLFKLLQKHSILHMSFAEPEPWKVEEWATKFLVKEAKSKGKVLETPLATAMVRVCGPDLGLLSFEMLKLSVYLDAIGETQVQPAHVRGIMAALTETSLFPLVDAVSQANAPAVLKQLSSIERTHSGDPTMRVCAILAYSVTNWIHAGSALRAGMDTEVAAQSVGTSAARMRRSILPAVGQWGDVGLRDLLGIIAGVERSVKAGRVNPWMLLQARLAASCRRSRASR